MTDKLTIQQWLAKHGKLENNILKKGVTLRNKTSYKLWAQRDDEIIQQYYLTHSLTAHEISQKYLPSRTIRAIRFRAYKLKKKLDPEGYEIIPAGQFGIKGAQVRWSLPFAIRENPDREIE